MTTPNLPLLRKVLDHIRNHPDEYNQKQWWTAVTHKAETECALGRVPVCGTTFCIAGHVVNMTEGIAVNDNGQLRPASGRSWPRAAAAHLGLEYADAVFLFDGDNTWHDVLDAAEEIAARAGEQL